MSQSYESTESPSLAKARWVSRLSWTNFLALVAVCYLLFGISENWWVGAVLTYAPHAPFVIPSVCLLIASIFWHRGSVGINLISLLTVIFPLMGLSIPVDPLLDSSSKERVPSLKLVSCNVQEFKPDFAKVLDEIIEIDPDVVALQEALATDDLLESHFRDWYKVHKGNFWVGSRYPVKLISTCEVTQFGGRLAGIVVEIQTPNRTIALANVHQMTARHGLTELNRRTLVDGDGTRELGAFESERYFESLDLRAAVNAAVSEQPLIVCGDFNTPVSSSLFQKHWGDLQSSFDIAGFGFGYTAPCKGNRFWPHNVPWARVDHVLCTQDWLVRHSQIGHSDGSDHRLIAATLRLKPGSQVSTIDKTQVSAR